MWRDQFSFNEKMRIYFIVIVRTKIYESKKAPSKKFSSHGVLSLTLKTALSSQPDFYWNPHPANLNFMSSLFTTQLCYYYFFSLSGMLKSSSFSLLYPTNWKTETEKKFDSCKYNSLKTFLNRFTFGGHSELRHLSLITLLGVFQRSCLRRLQF